MKTLSTVNHEAQSEPLRSFLRLGKPLHLIVAWGIYSLSALAYFAYQSALLGTLCGIPQ
jgi:hypothetical protein